MQQLYEQLADILEAGQQAVLASIVGHAGSTPRSSGAMMAILPDGAILGSVGGGILEARVQKMAPALFSRGGAILKPFLLSGAEAASLGMACGGDVTVFALALDAGGESAALYRELVRELESGSGCALLTELEGPDDSLALVSRRMVREGEEIQGFSRPGRLPGMLREGASLRILEPCAPPATLHLVGAGHVSFFTARLAVQTGFNVIVLDDREEFANRDRFPRATDIQVLSSFEDCLPRNLGPRDFAVIVTRGHLHDKTVLECALRTRAGYIGMIGSRKKRAATYAALLKEGFTQKDLERVFCPIGLAIGAETPEEIAVSIVAELIKVRAGLAREEAVA